MAYLRPLISRCVTQNLFQRPLFGQQCVRALFQTPSVSVAKMEANEDFFVKNERLGRPMSPHLTIYKPQLTSMLSITHRGCGVFLSSVLSGFGIGMVALPHSYPHYIELLQSLHYAAPLIFAVKFSLAWPLAFHACNGIRHLVWDAGYGFSMKTLYQTGYGVMAAATVIGLIAASM